MHEEFLNEFVDEEKNINEVIFENYLKYQNPSYLAKHLLKARKNKNGKLNIRLFMK